MEPEYSSIDRLCLWVAGAEWRVVSECNSLLSQSYSFRESQSTGLHGKMRIICLNLLMLQMRKLGPRQVKWLAHANQRLTQKILDQLLFPCVVPEVPFIWLWLPQCLSSN